MNGKENKADTATRGPPLPLPRIGGFAIYWSVGEVGLNRQRPAGKARRQGT